MELNDLTYKIIGCVYNVHSELGPGLLESTYEICLEYELLKLGLTVERQKPLPVSYDGIQLDAGYRIDLLVNGLVIIELKSVEELAPIHKSQVMTYLKLSGLKLALLLNFNVQDMKKGIVRIIM
ncbi:GxxExxY protein [Cyclobacterium xiamenense]|jgi:GxxExxY protein|uniref:GxxExxY protein n=1 Tax=Cyclobacterium xiamenense TaxID=1297121 RepID=UPI0012B74B5C|nr:GxxExxY protein [Cyclobacterium xiamenense]